MVDQGAVVARREALEDEDRVRATCRQVIETFGPLRPIVSIVEAEGRPAEALLAQFRRIEIAPQPGTWPGRVTTPAALAEACAAAVLAKIENTAMYDGLLAEVIDPELREVMPRLKEASQERHLPAFQRGLAREDGRVRPSSSVNAVNGEH
ncbi:MAG: hypothetical protein ACP5NP_08460 [Acetobacteraceae bacterium]